MIYLALSLACFASFTALHILQRQKPTAPAVGIANGVCGTIGVLLYPTAILVLRAYLRDSTDADFAAWAWDAFSLYLRFSLLTTAVLLALTILACVSAIVSKKHRKKARMRLSVTLFSAAAFLLTGPAYGFMTATEKIPLYPLVLTLAFASAFTMRWHAFAEWLLARRFVTEN